MPLGFSLLPLHHGGATGEDIGFIQGFVDSDGGNVLATFLHTFGALLFTAGLFLYVYQARLIKHARLQVTPSLRLLPLAHILNLSGIAMNGLGGLMRLYQSDHPRLDQVGSSLWVQVIFVKHLFLIVGVGLAAFLTLRTHLLAQSDEAPQNFFPETRRITTFAAASFATIIVASVLGAIASSAPLPAAQGMEGSGQALSFPVDMGSGTETVITYANASGFISGTMVQPGRASSSLAVPAGTTEVWVELTWRNSTRSSLLDLTLHGPDGKPVGGQKKTWGPARVMVVVDANATEGTWQAVVTTTRALNEDYNLVGRVTQGPVPTSYEQTFFVNPDAAASFVEINLRMKVGQRFHYAWQVVESPASLDFNIHLHIDGQVLYPVRGSWNRHGGEYEHNETRTDGVSLMWENPSTESVKVHCRIVGDFKVDSVFARE